LGVIGIEEELVVKGKKGILASMKTRRKFLSVPSHPIGFVYIPRHISWMNQAEIGLSIH
jgi:hypothetical protein